MNITINVDDSTKIKVEPNSKIIKNLNHQYPEMAMMTAMEECSELAIAISKCVRNGSPDKKDNLAEEIVDVLTVIQWAIDRFNIDPNMIARWAKVKYDRTKERAETDGIIFRSNDALNAYTKHHCTVDDNGLIITRNKNSQYEITGDTENIPEYYHVLRTHLVNKCDPSVITDLMKKYNICNEEVDIDFTPSDIDDNDHNETHESFSKKTSKELSKIIERANKNAKHIDKKKKGKKGKK